MIKAETNDVSNLNQPNSAEFNKKKYKQQLLSKSLAYTKKIKQLRRSFIASIVGVLMLVLLVSVATYFSFEKDERYLIVGLFFVSILIIYMAISKIPDLRQSANDLEDKKMLYLTQSLLVNIFKHVEIFEDGRSQEYLKKSFNGAFQECKKVASGVEFGIRQRKSTVNIFTLITDFEKIEKCDVVSVFQISNNHGIEADFTITKDMSRTNFWDDFSVYGLDKDQLEKVLTEKQRKLVDDLFQIARQSLHNTFNAHGAQDIAFMIQFLEGNIMVAYSSKYPSIFSEKDINSIASEYNEKIDFIKNGIRLIEQL